MICGDDYWIDGWLIEQGLNERVGAVDFRLLT